MRILCKLSAAIVVALVSSAARPAQAQVPDDQRAVLAFDVYFDRLMSSDLAQETGLNDPNSIPTGPDDPIRPGDLRRVYGAIAAPADVATLQAASDGSLQELPFNFFVRLQHKSDKAAEAAFATMSKDSETVTIGGKNYVRPPAAETNTPRNMLAHLSAPDTIELGTDGYITLADRNVFTQNLTTAWPNMPKAAIRIGVDLDGARHLIDEGLKMAEGGIPPQAQPALGFVTDTSVLRIGLDFSGDNLLWLTATGRDADAATRVNGILGGLATMGQSMGKQMLPMAGPDAQGPGEVILNALATTQDGNDVNLTIPRPDGIEKVLGGFFEQALMAGMGGMGDPAIEMDLGGAGSAFEEPSGLDAMPGGAESFGDADPFGGAGPGQEAAVGEPDPFGEPAGAGADPFGN